MRNVARGLTAMTMVLAAGLAQGQTWQGAVELPTGEMGLTIKLDQRDSGWVGTIDIPDQSVLRGPLADIEWGEAGELSFRADLAGMPVANQPVFKLKPAEGGKLTGSVMQGPGSFLVNLDKTSETAQMGKAQEPGYPLAYRSEDVTVPVVVNAEVQHELAGTLTLPDKEAHGEGPYPAVILLSGSGGQDRDETIAGHKPFFVLSDRLTKAGIAVLRCDDRGVGLSGGVFEGSTMTERTEDAKSSIRWLAEHESIDGARIGIIGHSEGGILAPMVASGEEDDGVAFLVLLAPPTVPGGQVITEQSAEMQRRSGRPEEDIASTKEGNLALFRAIAPDAEDGALLEAVTEIVTEKQPADMPPAMKQRLIETMVEQLSDPWLREFVYLDPAMYLAKVDEPVLVLFGEQDVQVLPWQNEQPARDALADNMDATVQVLDGLNHLFQPAETGLGDEYATSEVTFDEDTMAKIASWINERFGSE